MSDLRQGVTPAGHDVLDALDMQRPSSLGLEEELRLAHARAANASRAKPPANRRRFAVEAAARLILAIEALDEAEAAEGEALERDREA